MKMIFIGQSFLPELLLILSTVQRYSPFKDA